MGEKLKILDLENKVKEAIANGEHLALIDMACLLIYEEPMNDHIENYFLEKYLEKKERFDKKECERYALTETLKYLQENH